MPTNGNWFAVSRMIFDHAVIGIKNRPYTELEAWLWLLAEAEFEPREVANKGQMIVLDPGQLMAAHGFLSKRWSWTQDKVRYFLKKLQNEAMIARYCAKQDTGRNTNQIQIITISNYSDYQFTQDAEHQAIPQPQPHTNGANTKQNTNPAPSAEVGVAQAKMPVNKGISDGPPQAKVLAPPDLHQAKSQESNTKEHLTLKDSNSLDREDDLIAGKQACIQAVIDYNLMAQRCGLPEVRTSVPLSEPRKRALRLRLKECAGMEGWRQALGNIEKSAFLRGQNDRGWRADFDWLVTPAKFIRVLEGRYGNGAHAPAQPTVEQERERHRLMRQKLGERGYVRWLELTAEAEKTKGGEVV